MHRGEQGRGIKRRGARSSEQRTDPASSGSEKTFRPHHLALSARPEERQPSSPASCHERSPGLQEGVVGRGASVPSERLVGAQQTSGGGHMNAAAMNDGRGDQEPALRKSSRTAILKSFRRTQRTEGMRMPPH